MTDHLIRHRFAALHISLITPYTRSIINREKQQVRLFFSCAVTSPFQGKSPMADIDSTALARRPERVFSPVLRVGRSVSKCGRLQRKVSHL